MIQIEARTLPTCDAMEVAESEILMDDESRAYLERRAAHELACARRAASPQAMRAHYILLSHYLERLCPGGAVLARREERTAG